MDIKQIKYFLQLCKDENFSKAARNLYITQQGLSKSIRNLEEEIHAPLFYRMAQGIVLTEYGEYLKKQSVHLMQEFDRLNDGIQSITNANEGQIKIGAAFGVISALSPDKINDFQLIYPNIELNIIEYPDAKCEAAVLQGEVDLGFTIGEVDKTKFHSKIIKTEKLCVLVNEQNPLSQKKEIEFADLKHEKIISVNPEFKLYHNFVNKCKENGFEPNIILTTQEMILVHNLSRQQKGIGISVYFFLEDLANVNAIPFKDPSFLWQVCLITKKDSVIPHIVKKFWNYMVR